VDAENSHASSEDQGEGSAVITMTLLDQHGNPYTEEEFGKDDISLSMYGDDDRTDISGTLNQIADDPGYTTSLSVDDEVYTVNITCTADWTDGKMDVTVDGELIEENAEFILTGS